MPRSADLGAHMGSLKCEVVQHTGLCHYARSIFQLSPISTPINHNKPWSHEGAIIVFQRGQCHSCLVIPHSIRDLSAFNPKMHQDILATACAPLVWMRLGSWRRAVAAAGGPIMAHPPRPAVARDQRSRSTRQRWRGCKCVQELCQRLCVLGQAVVSIPSTMEKINTCWSALTLCASSNAYQDLRLSVQGKSWNHKQKSKYLQVWINVGWG